MRLTARAPRVSTQLRAAAQQYQRDLRDAARIATDRASKDAQRALQDKIRSVGLGRLAGAVGQKSSLRAKGTTSADRPYGVIFARGGDDSLAGGALESYSRGATITARNGVWLAFATAAVPNLVAGGRRRQRITPKLYASSGLAATLGPLVFKPIGPNRAVLVIRRAAVNIRTGRARTPLQRASKVSVNQRDVVAFVLIRVTRRGQRFDKDAVIGVYARRMPRYMAAALDEVRRGRA